MQKEMAMRMLNRRGLDVTVESAGFKDRIQYVQTRDALVAIVSEGKVTVDVLKTILSLPADPRALIVLVYASTCTSEAKQALQKLHNVNAFHFDEMAFDLVRVVPQHSVVGGPKPKEWDKFPIILVTDPVSRYYAFKRGDVIRVSEDDGTISYKRCV